MRPPLAPNAITWAAREAVIKDCTIGKARTLYATYNRRYFHNKLPKDVEITWGSTCQFMTPGERRRFNCQSYGMTIFWEDVEGHLTLVTITISDLLKKHLALLATTILHEMAHVATRHGGHGPKFQAVKRRLMREGAYDQWT